MTFEKQKEEFSIAYITTVAAAAGCAVDRVTCDYDSVDLRISSRLSGAMMNSPLIEVQAKCTSGSPRNDDYIRFDLPVKNYNDLRKKSHLPRILVVVLVPKESKDWLVHTEEFLSVYRCGYWVSLAGREEKDNKNTVAVHMPRAQQFTDKAVLAMMKKVADGDHI